MERLVCFSYEGETAFNVRHKDTQHPSRVAELAGVRELQSPVEILEEKNLAASGSCDSVPKTRPERDEHESLEITMQLLLPRWWSLHSEA